MKLMPNKTFPHPVLWKRADDYIRREFQATRSFSLNEEKAPVIEFEFVVNEESIRDRIKKHQAIYALEIYCPATLVRHVFNTNKNKGEFTLQKGDLYGRVEVNAFIVCTRGFKHHSKNFNSEFGNNALFELMAGDVLATVDTDIYHWDTGFLAPIHSVIDLVANGEIEAGTYAVDTDEQKIKIQMNPRDKMLFESMRQASEHKPIAMFVYFPAIVEVLQQMKNTENGRDVDKKWYRAIEYKLREMGKDISEIDPFMVAQKLLRNPLKFVLPKQSRG